MQLTDKIRALLAQRLPMRQIAKQCKCSHWQVYKVSMLTADKLPVGRPRKAASDSLADPIPDNP